jgi:hypothetical protein
MPDEIILEKIYGKVRKVQMDYNRDGNNLTHPESIKICHF